MCTALPALSERTTMLIVSHCGEQLGSKCYTDLMLRWDNDWRAFLEHIKAHCNTTELDQWEFQMQTKVLGRIGTDKLCLVSDGIPADVQKHIAVNPVLGQGTAQERAQRAIDDYVATNPNARIGIIPDGPYTMLRTK